MAQLLNFYQIVKENLSFNRFQHGDTVCLEYTCPLDAEEIGIFSRNDYVVHVLSGKKTYKTVNGEWTLQPGQTLYLKKGAEIIHQYFDDQYCMLGFFISDELIKEVFKEIRGVNLSYIPDTTSATTGFEVATTDLMQSYFQSMLAYFRGDNRPPDPILLLKIKELLITLMNGDPTVSSYFELIANTSKPSLRQIMENNFCFNLKLEEFAELTHRSLASFKRDFQKQFNEAPGKWLQKRKVEHATKLLNSTNLSITQIAFESGFEDLSHFSRAYKKITGRSPSELKKA